MLNFKTGIKREELDQELLIKLEQASVVSDMDYVITSGYRAGVDGVDHGIKNGPHMSHKAVDLRCNDSTTRYKILYGLFKVGFKRVGIGKIHLHADLDETKPQNVVWLELQDDQPGNQ
jgi:hypothetical protein